MTATLDNSKRLYELTGWGEKHRMDWWIDDGVWGVTMQSDYEGGNEVWQAPAYDSDYLLEKLPAKIKYDDEDYFLVLWPSGFAEPELWFAAYTDADYVDMPFLANTDTPADALCLLAIKLKEEGVM